MMRKYCSLLVLVLSINFAYSQRNIDVLHYQFSVILNDANDSIYCNARIRLRATENLNKINLDLKNIGPGGKGMKVNGLLLKTSSTGKEYNPQFEHVNNSVGIKTSDAIKKGDTLTIAIDYSGIPADGLIISKNKYGKRTFFADNWPNRGHNWLACVDDPADKASVDFIVIAPGHYQVVSNGIQVEEHNLNTKRKRTHWREDVPISTKVMVIGVAEFAVQLAGTVQDCIPVTSWVYPEDDLKGYRDYSQAVEILPFFIKNVGPYPYKKLANVQSKTIFGGLENANTIFYSETSVTGRRQSEAVVAHEIAHQWFGNMATEKSFAHLWLSEGFATYMAILYMENKYGADTARYMLNEDRDQVVAFSKRNNAAVVDNNPDYMELLNANSYQKGGWVLHMLRRQLGDSIFWKGVRKYYADFAGKIAGTEDVQRSFEIVSGKKLDKFFKQWLYTPGQPDIKVQWFYDAVSRKVWLEIVQQKGLFDFPLEIGIKEASGKINVSKLNISETNNRIGIKVRDKPREIILDPNQSLLFNGTISEKR